MTDPIPGLGSVCVCVCVCRLPNPSHIPKEQPKLATTLEGNHPPPPPHPTALPPQDELHCPLPRGGLGHTQSPSLPCSTPCPPPTQPLFASTPNITTPPPQKKKTQTSFPTASGLSPLQPRVGKAGKERGGCLKVVYPPISPPPPPQTQQLSITEGGGGGTGRGLR